MDDGIDVPGGEYMLEDFAIEDRAFDERTAFFVNVCYGANAPDGFGRAICVRRLAIGSASAVP